MSYNSESDYHIIDKIKVVLDLSNCATKVELEHASSVDTSNLAAAKGFIASKAEDDKLGINKFVHVPNRSKISKTKVDDLSVGELKTVQIQLTGNKR